MKNKREPDELPIALWERLTLALNKDGERTEFLTRVEDIRENSFVLEMPVRQTGKANLLKGDLVEVSYNKKDAVYTFKANITDLFEDDRNCIELKQSGDISRVQRRRFVRLDISGDIKFRLVDLPGAGAGGIGNELEGSLLNISAGGVLFETEAAINENNLLVLSFSLRDREKLKNILALVKRAELMDDGIYLVGAEFITEDNLSDFGLDSLKDFLPPGTGTFDENLQKLLVQFIYKQQVDLRKKGLLSS